jgi:hypothetical protein
MASRTVQIVARYAFGVFAVLLMSIGLLMFVSSYLSRMEDTENAFSVEVLSIAIFLLPVAIFFSAKTVKSYRSMNSKYGLPDTPVRSFILMASSILLVIFIIVTIAIYIVASRSAV